MNSFDLFVYALCVWREARNSHEGMVAVAWVIKNRLLTGKWGATIADVVEDKLQFSSMTALGDPGTVIWPNTFTSKADMTAWKDALQICQQVATAGQAEDITNGSTYYFAESIPKPSWADAMTLVATIGGQQFYRG